MKLECGLLPWLPPAGSIAQRTLRSESNGRTIDKKIDGLSSTGINGEGGIRTHEGVTPTRFRVVRNQPDSATSPHAVSSVP